MFVKSCARCVALINVCVLLMVATATLTGCSGGDDNDDEPSPYVDNDNDDDFATLVVQNNTRFTTTGVYVSPSSASEWGDNLLQNSVIRSGQALTISRLPCPAEYDVRIVDNSSSGGTELYEVPFECGRTQTVNLNYTR